MATTLENITGAIAEKYKIIAAINEKSPSSAPTAQLSSLATAVASIPVVPNYADGYKPRTETVPAYTWTKPEGWPDAEEIYEANKDASYENNVLVIMDAEKIGRRYMTLADGVTGPRTVVCGGWKQSTATATGNNVGKYIFSDGTSTEVTSGMANFVHTFTGTDRYVWVIMCGIGTGNYPGIGTIPDFGNNPEHVLQVYGDDNSRIETYNGGPLYMARFMRRIDIGTLGVTSSSALATCLQLEYANIGKVVVGVASDSLFQTDTAVEKIEIGEVSGYDGVHTSSMASWFSGCRMLRSIDIGAMNVYPYSIKSWFDGDKYLQHVSVQGLDTRYCHEMSYVFNEARRITDVPAEMKTRYSGTVERIYRLSDMSPGSDSQLMTGKFDFSSATTCYYALYSETVALGKTELEVYVGNACTNVEGLFYNQFRLERLTGRIDTSNVTTCGNMFTNCFSLRNWPDSVGRSMPKCASISGVCSSCFSLLEIDGLELSNKLTNASSAFSTCVSLRKASITMDTSNVTSTASMFQNCYNLHTVDINSGEEYAIDAPNLTTSYVMFSGCYSLRRLGKIRIGANGKLTRVDSMFAGCYQLEDIDVEINFAAVQYLGSLFYNCKMLRSVTFDIVAPNANQTASSLFNSCWRLSECPSRIIVQKTSSVSSMFASCYVLENGPDEVDAKVATSADSMFAACYNMKSVGTINIPATKTTYNMFQYCHALLEAPAMTLGAVTSAYGMFSECNNLVDASGVSFPNATCTRFDGMFLNCYSLVRGPSTINMGATVQCNSMFAGCVSLETLPATLKMSTKCTNAASMFAYCTALKTLPAGLDFSACTNVSSLFAYCRSLTALPATLDIGKASSTANMSSMFAQCYSLKTLPTSMKCPTGSFAYTVDFADCLAIDDKTTVTAFAAGLNNVTNASYKRTVKFNAHIKTLFTDDEISSLASTLTSKGWTLAW